MNTEGDSKALPIYTHFSMMTGLTSSACLEIEDRILKERGADENFIRQMMTWEDQTTGRSLDMLFSSCWRNKNIQIQFVKHKGCDILQCYGWIILDFFAI